MQAEIFKIFIVSSMRIVSWFFLGVSSPFSGWQGPLSQKPFTNDSFVLYYPHIAENSENHHGGLEQK